MTQPTRRELVLESLLRDNAETFRYLRERMPAELRNERRLCELGAHLADMMLAGPFRRAVASSETVSREGAAIQVQRHRLSDAGKAMLSGNDPLPDQPEPRP